MKRSATLSHWKNSLNWTTLHLAASKYATTMLQLVYVRIATVSHTSPSLNLGTSLIPHCCGLLCQTESNKSSIISTKMLENENYKCMKYIWCSSMKLDRTGSGVQMDGRRHAVLLWIVFAACESTRFPDISLGVGCGISICTIDPLILIWHLNCCVCIRTLSVAFTQADPRVCNTWKGGIPMLQSLCMGCQINITKLRYVPCTHWGNNLCNSFSEASDQFT